MAWERTEALRKLAHKLFENAAARRVVPSGGADLAAHSGRSPREERERESEKEFL